MTTGGIVHGFGFQVLNLTLFTLFITPFQPPPPPQHTHSRIQYCSGFFLRHVWINAHETL